VKRVAFAIVLSYACLFIVLTLPVLWGCFYSEVQRTPVLNVFSFGPYWAWLAVMLLCESALLLVPVKVAARRPVSRRSIYIPVIASALLMGCLLLGLVCSIAEFVQQQDALREPWQGWSALGASVLLWVIWSIVFSRVARQGPPRDVVSRQCRHLIQGSALSLLVAVPTHIVARHRDYCCAGYLTFVGIVFGLAVMLLSFGPGIFFLYISRWKGLQARAGRL